MAANLLIFDCSNLIHRIYHATAVSTPEDRLLNFARARLKKSIAALIREVDPLRVVAAFDAPEPSFRYGLVEGYKGHRSEKPVQLSALLRDAPQIFAEVGCENLYAPHHEADDVIATIADQCLAVGGWRCVVVSNDADLLSCAHDSGGGEGVFALRNKQSAYQLWGPEEVLADAKIGVTPNRVSFLKSLVGDPSDGYSGITGIGPVAARRFCDKAANMKRLYSLLDDPKAFTKGERGRLEAFGLDAALVQERVARLVRSAPIRELA